MNLKKSLRIALATKGISQNQLGRETGVPGATLSRIEKCTVTTLKKVCNHLNYKVSEFIALGED